MSTQEPPGIDLGKLEHLQRWVQYSMIVAVVVTVALFLYASMKLAGIYADLNIAQQDLLAKKIEVETKQKRITALDKEIETRNEAIRGLDALLGKVSRPVTPQPDVQDTRKHIPPRVYVQIFDEKQRPRAQEFEKALEARRFLVPGIENVSMKAEPQAVSDIRFYGQNNEPSDIAAIRDIAARDFGVTLKEIRLRESGGLRPRHYEVWLGNDFAAK